MTYKLQLPLRKHGTTGTSSQKGPIMVIGNELHYYITGNMVCVPFNEVVDLNTPPSATEKFVDMLFANGAVECSFEVVDRKPVPVPKRDKGPFGLLMPIELFRELYPEEGV